MELTKELIEKAKTCQTAEELIALAKANDIELSAEEAALYLQDFAEGELSDEELDNVAGGQEGCAKPAKPYETVYWKNKEDVQFIFKEGDLVQAFVDWCLHHTVTCKVVSRRVHRHEYNKYSDQYWLEKEPGAKGAYIKRWSPRSNIEKS